MGSRLKAVPEPKSPEVGLLDEVCRILAIFGQPEGKVVERSQMLDRLVLKGGCICCRHLLERRVSP